MRQRSAIRNWAEYLGLRGVSATLTCFPPEQNLHTAAAIGSAFFRAGKSRAQRAIDNIQQSFPDWTPEECEHVAEASMQHMFQLFLVDALFMPRLITPTTWPRHVEIGDVQRALELLEPGRPALLFTGHCGNWELLGYTLAMLGFPMSALARPLDNPLLNRWLLGIREARGLKIITKFGATPAMHETLLRGDLVGFIADQNAGDGGLFVPFLGRLASSYKSIGLLAMRYRTPVIAGIAVRRDQTMRYRFVSPDVILPQEWDEQPDPLFYITARVNRAMESMIREAPSQYLWIHRRWKSRPRHERRGQKFPAPLRRKIESLPWMTDDEVARIIEHSERESARQRGGDVGTTAAAAVPTITVEPGAGSTAPPRVDPSPSEPASTGASS
ncbi:MAG: lysophospholipid acyltransferase family protein [Phycisphaerales bacterium]